MSLDLDDDELKDEADVSDADVLIAVALWMRYAPAQYKTIIQTDDAVYQWSQSEMTYRKNGVKVDPTKLRTAAVDPFLANVKIAVRDLSAQLQRGEISTIEWQTQMNSLVKGSQLAASLVANGGTRNSTQNDYAAIALSIFLMLKYLQSFAADIDSGAQKKNGTLLSRAGLYASAGRDAYEEARRVGMSKYAGATMERRVLWTGANHCTTDGEMLGCVELADMGWRPIGSLPRLYSTPCRTNCLCSFQFR